MTIFIRQLTWTDGDEDGLFFQSTEEGSPIGLYQVMWVIDNINPSGTGWYLRMGDVALHSHPLADADAAKSMAQADYEARVMAAVSVTQEAKALVWKKISDDAWDMTADCELGEYVISVDSWQTGGVHYLWLAGTGEGEEHDAEFTSLKDAKDAAQADYAARAALKPQEAAE